MPGSPKCLKKEKKWPPRDPKIASGGGKIMTEIVATKDVARQLPEQRPTTCSKN